MHIDFHQLRFLTVAADIKSCPETDLPEIVLTGRSNSGKSSLVNALAGQRRLSRVSGTPGKTRLVVYYGIPQVLLLADLPGYGYAQASKKQVETFSKLADTYFQSDRPIALALVVMDIRHEPTASDQLMLRFLQDQNIDYIPIFNKADKLSRAARFQRLHRHKSWLARAGFDSGAMIVSTQSGEGVTELAHAIAARLEARSHPQ